MNRKEYEQRKAKTLSQFGSGKALFAKRGVFAYLLKNFLNKVLKAKLLLKVKK